MPYIDPEVIVEAKKMDLLTYLQNYEPGELVRFSGGVYKTRTHPNLKISNGKWCLWNDNGDPGEGGRSALDYLIKLRGMKFTEAVEQIAGRTATAPPVFVSQKKAPPKELILPKYNVSQTRMINYLESRGIDRDIVAACSADGLLYESAPYHNIVFVGKNLDGKERYATLRGAGTAFKGEAPGSDKRFAFGISPPDSESDTVHYFEGAIDALSYATLQKLNEKPFNQDYLWTLGGVYNSKRHIEERKLPDSIEQFHKDRPHVKRAVFHLDNDLVGRAATKMIMSVLSDRCEVIDEPPPVGKDYNDTLCALLNLPNQTKTKSHAR